MGQQTRGESHSVGSLMDIAVHYRTPDMDTAMSAAQELAVISWVTTTDASACR